MKNYLTTNKQPRVTSLNKVQGNQEKRAKRIRNTVSEFWTQLTPQFAKSVGGVGGFAAKQADTARSSRGDTIVEVMMSLVILSMILATVYAMGTRSLRAGTESNQRTEALSIAQSQIDLLVNAKNIDPSFAQNFQTDQAYCLKPDGTKDISAQNNPNKLCNSYSGGQYSIGVSYDLNVFTVTAQWPSADAPNGTANLNLYYKLPGVYKKALVTAGSATTAGTSATINGTVNPNGNLVTDCYFNYDTSLTYSHAKKAACSSLPGSGTSDVAVSANISGLDTNSVYYFQLCATNIVGTACSVNNGTFTTPSLPTISNEAAKNTASASGNNADLVAQINPNGTTVTDCYFEWGTTTGYGSKKNCGGTIGSGTTPVPVSVNVAPLTVGITYHFRVVATNAAGTKTGGDHTFVTSRPPKPTVSLSASPAFISYNTSTTLTWSSTGATSCSGSNFSTGGATSGSAGTGRLGGPETYNYSVTCDGAGGSATDNASVSVGAPPPSPPPPPPPSVYLCENAYFDDNYGTCWGPFGLGTNCSWVERCGVRNDAVSAFKAVNGVSVVTVYLGINYGGQCGTFYSDNGWVGSNWNDQISSFRVSEHGQC